MIYPLILRIVQYGQYDRADLAQKLEVYHQYGRINTEQYQELCARIASAQS